ncbi:hypothetical protein [Sinomonas susongensis]|uniref:hypothetical protein n=1 Tax=Sinomonas susongensis TaxID=1324851 RepID=UPI001BB23169|nr:hypothetical protein [Sinomonas susongensis]
MEPTDANGASREDLAIAMAGNRKVIVRKGKAEVHGYLVSVGEARAKVLWVCGTGRTQRRDVPLSELVLPSSQNPWQGIEISVADLVAATERRRSRSYMSQSRMAGSRSPTVESRPSQRPATR